MNIRVLRSIVCDNNDTTTSSKSGNSTNDLSEKRCTAQRHEERIRENQSKRDPLIEREVISRLVHVTTWRTRNVGT